MKYKNQIVTSLCASLLSVAVIAASGCGKPGFTVSSATENLPSPGHYVVPAKVDILLVQDNTGSMFEPFEQLKSRMPGFLDALQTKGWDYHFAVVPLTELRPLATVTASHYDGNWGADWLAPYPGAKQTTPGTVLASVFTRPENFGGFLSRSEISSHDQGSEPGLLTLMTNLGDASVKQTHFLRDDALFIVLVVSNGNDNSNVHYCTRSDGVSVPCEQLGHPLCVTGDTDPNCGSVASSFADLKTQFASIKSDPRQLRMFSLVSAANHINDTCFGGNSFAGTRYINLASALNGKSYDICNVPIANVLDSLDSELAGSRLAMRTKYLFMAEEPELSTVVVNKNGAVLPQDATNGWTYAGYVSDVYTIDSPIDMNLASGFAIELHGTAKLLGDDSANVTYKPHGAQDIH